MDTVADVVRVLCVSEPSIVKALLVEMTGGALLLLCAPESRQVDLAKVSRALDADVHLISRHRLAGMPGLTIGASSPITTQGIPLLVEASFDKEDFVHTGTGNPRLSLQLPPLVLYNLPEAIKMNLATAR